MENPPSPVETSRTEEKPVLNPYLRCPLPPFSTTVDTIRQWNMTGKNPVMRVIPLPTQQGAGGGAASNVTNVTSTSGGGSSSTVTTSLLPQTIFVNVPALIPGQTFTATLKMSQSYQLLQAVSTNAAVEIRLYSNPLTQTIDISRQTDVQINFVNVEGVISDITLDAAPFIWNWENRIGANADNPQSVNTYATFVNPSQTTGTPATTVIIVFLPLEA